jgi:predicted lipid-binding transport protein (Tim44 family)
MKFKKLIVITSIISLLTSQLAFAGRIGGGRSRGMQRSMPSYSQSNRNYGNYNNNRNSQQNIPNSQPQQNQTLPRNGIGAGSAALMGAAAGAAGGYLLGKNSNNNQNDNNIQNSQSTIESINSNNAVIANKDLTNKSQIPWGTIIILFAILLIGIAFFRKKTATTNFANYTDDRSINNNFQSNHSQYNSSHNKDTNIQQNFVNNANQSEKLADGIEKEFFLRQAKGMFLHIQSMNNKENVNEIAKYFTDDLYQSIKDEIANNDSIADFTNLECSLIDSKIENDGLVASVKFTGMVSDNPNKKAEQFAEIWNFLKKDIKINKWIVAGIQQI